MRPTALLLLGACAFRGPALPGDGGADARPDAPTDDSPAGDATGDGSAPPCWARWHAGPSLGAPVKLAGVNSAGTDRDLYITPDERELFFSSDRAGSTDKDIWYATRTTATDPFGTPARRADLSTAGWDSKLTLSADRLTVILTSNAGGKHTLWHATRPAADQPFGALDQTLLGMVDTADLQFDPHLSTDGLRLYFGPSSPTQHLAIARRAQLGQDFGPPALIAELNSAGADGDPAVSADERVMVFTSTRGGNADLWYATRADPTQSWGAPALVPGVNTSSVEGDPQLAGDGCHLYFASTAGGTDYNIWVSTVVP